MNHSNVFCLNIAATSSFAEHSRVAVGRDGLVRLAGANERGIGHLIQPVNGSEGRLQADIAKNSAVGLQYGITSAAIAAGQRVLPAADGKVAPLPNIGLVDDDGAAANGTDVLVAVNADGTAFLNSTTANNADTVAQLGNGGPVIQVDDNDAPVGVALYFDEDGEDEDNGVGRFLCVSPTGADVLVAASNGTFVRVYHDADAATNGVAVHIDDDAANKYERLLFISPTDTDGVAEVDDTTDNVSIAVCTEASLSAGAIVRITYR